MKLILIYFGIIILISCRETKTVIVNNCLQTTTIKWSYTMPGHSVGFKIFAGEKYPSALLATIPLSNNPAMQYTHEFDICKCTYINIAAFDDLNNESPTTAIAAIGSGCRQMENKKNETKDFPPPSIELE